VQKTKKYARKKAMTLEVWEWEAGLASVRPVRQQRQGRPKASPATQNASRKFSGVKNKEVRGNF